MVLPKCVYVRSCYTSSFPASKRSTIISIIGKTKLLSAFILVQTTTKWNHQLEDSRPQNVKQGWGCEHTLLYLSPSCENFSNCPTIWNLQIRLPFKYCKKYSENIASPPKRDHLGFHLWSLQALHYLGHSPGVHSRSPTFSPFIWCRWVKLTCSEYCRQNEAKNSWLQLEW